MNTERAMKPTAKQLAAMSLYAALMEEAKTRLLWIDEAINHRLGLVGEVIVEFSVLQLRYLSELIALGCLAAHGDIEEIQSAKFQQEYRADRILNILSKLHEDFYPHPYGEIQVLADGTKHITAFVGDYLAKPDLLTLDRKCGELLHRGTLKSIVNPRALVDLREIATIAQRISELLRLHRIMLIGGDVMLCILRNPDNDGKVQVVFGSAGAHP